VQSADCIEGNGEFLLQTSRTTSHCNFGGTECSAVTLL